MLRGLAAFRWAAWVWMATVLALARAALVRPEVALALVAAALLVTVWTTRHVVRTPGRPLGPAVVGVEVVVALGLQFADGFVYRAPHVFTTQQPLGVAWPIAAAMSAGVGFGPMVGSAVGVALGVARGASSALAVHDAPVVEALQGSTPEQALSVVTTIVLYASAGGFAGYLTQLIRRAEHRITAAERDLASAAAREDIARRLHDGVLQTLALVERRADDPALAQLARVQERELRHYLFATGDDRVIGRGVLGDALREAGDRFELTFGTRVEVLVPDDVPELGPASVEAIAAATGEALTNVGRHAGATRVVVLAEPDDAGGVTVSVRDDGTGFDPATTPEGVGRSRSIRGRLEELGGSADWLTRPGRGCEVRLHLPG